MVKFSYLCDVIQIQRYSEMNEFEIKRMTELVLYVLGKGEYITQYYLYKILYFAERKHLARWGRGIMPGEFHAWECGPVPKKIYGGVKHYADGIWPIDIALKSVLRRADKDMGDYLIPLRAADMDYISQSETEAIDESFAENIGLDVSSLMRKSHDTAWLKAWLQGRDTAIRSTDIARAEGADDSMIDYIAETEAVRIALGQ